MWIRLLVNHPAQLPFVASCVARRHPRTRGFEQGTDVGLATPQASFSAAKSLPPPRGWSCDNGICKASLSSVMVQFGGGGEKIGSFLLLMVSHLLLGPLARVCFPRSLFCTAESRSLNVVSLL